MRKDILAFALSLAAVLPFAAGADELVVGGDAAPELKIALPKKGEARRSVLKSFGEPQKKFAPVGGETPKHPPITRWDYAGFSVFFERDHVVDAVVPGRPAQVYHRENLQPVSASH
ncbi:MAG: hypothetical protein NVS9B10_07380 [Nevskia sp.]